MPRVKCVPLRNEHIVQLERVLLSRVEYPSVIYDNVMQALKQFDTLQSVRSFRDGALRRETEFATTYAASVGATRAETEQFTRFVRLRCRVAVAARLDAFQVMMDETPFDEHITRMREELHDPFWSRYSTVIDTPPESAFPCPRNGHIVSMEFLICTREEFPSVVYHDTLSLIQELRQSDDAADRWIETQRTREAKFVDVTLAHIDATPEASMMFHAFVRSRCDMAISARSIAARDFMECA